MTPEFRTQLLEANMVLSKKAKEKVAFGKDLHSCYLRAEKKSLLPGARQRGCRDSQMGLG